MSKALEYAIERLTPGITLEVVESTYRPKLAGTTRTVTGRAKGSRRLFNCDSSDRPGHNYCMELPRHGLTWLDDDTVRYPIGRRTDDGTHHIITLRFVECCSDCGVIATTHGTTLHLEECPRIVGNS
jgi:hypothetical protein